MAKMSHNYESLIMMLNKIDPLTGQLQFTDKTGTPYHTYAGYVQFIGMDLKDVESIDDFLEVINYTEEDYI